MRRYSNNSAAQYSNAITVPVQAPSIVLAGNATARVGEPFTVTATVTDATGAPVSGY